MTRVEGTFERGDAVGIRDAGGREIARGLSAYAWTDAVRIIGKKSSEALVGHSIVTMPAPSLGYALLVEFYPNPVMQPDIMSTATSWHDAVDRVFANEVDAAIIPTALKNQYPNLTPVKTSPVPPVAMPGLPVRF